MQLRLLNNSLLAILGMAWMLGLPVDAAAQTPFVHPGVMHTAADLTRIKERVAAGAEPYLTAWNRARTDSRASLTYAPRAYAVLQRIPDAVSYGQLIQDAHAAELHAIAWVITGNTQHAAKAVEILNAWSSTLTSIPSTGDPVLTAGIAGHQVVAAAEALRATYPAWAIADQEQLKAKLVTLFYPPLHNFLIYHEPDGLVHTNTGVNQHFYTNWDAAAMVTIGAIGVFADDRAKYQEALDNFKNGTGNGAIFRTVWDASTGQMMESGRDPEHAQLGIGLLAMLCEIAWNQGDDLYGYDNNRLLKGIEYTASYIQGNTVPFAPYSDPYRTHTMISQEATPAQITSARNTPRPIYELVWNHYVQRRGVPAPFTKQVADRVRPEGFRADHIGYGTLFHTREPGGAPDAGSTDSGGVADAGAADSAGSAGAGGTGSAGSAGRGGASGGGAAGNGGTSSGGAAGNGGTSSGGAAGEGGRATGGNAGTSGSGGTTPPGSGGAGVAGTGPAGAGAGGSSGGSQKSDPGSVSGCGCWIAAPKRPGAALGLLSALGLSLALRRSRQRL